MRRKKLTTLQAKDTIGARGEFAVVGYQNHCGATLTACFKQNVVQALASLGIQIS